MRCVFRRAKFANGGDFDHFCANRGQNRRHSQTSPSKSPFARGPFRETAVEGSPRSRNGHSTGRKQLPSGPPSRLHLRLRPATPSRPAPKRHSSSRPSASRPDASETYVSTSLIAFFRRAPSNSPRHTFCPISHTIAISPGAIHFHERVFNTRLHLHERNRTALPRSASLPTSFKHLLRERRVNFVLVRNIRHDICDETAHHAGNDRR